jgi:hypothetical protein
MSPPIDNLASPRGDDLTLPGSDNLSPKKNQKLKSVKNKSDTQKSSGRDDDAEGAFNASQENATAATTSMLTQYLERVKELLRSRACIHNAFTASDRRLATAMFERHVQSEVIECGVMWACWRWYHSSINSVAGIPAVACNKARAPPPEVDNAAAAERRQRPENDGKHQDQQYADQKTGNETRTRDSANSSYYNQLS